MVKYCSNCGAKLDGTSNLFSQSQDIKGVTIRNFIGDNDNIRLLDEKSGNY